MSATGTRRGFVPGAGIPGVEDPPAFQDAADLLLDSTGIDQPSDVSGLLILADGTRFTGRLFGADAIAQGELVFTTGMCGYQESLTDPSFAGQVLTFTWPLLGNYGIIPGISESSGVHPRGVVCRQMMGNPDHRDSIGSIHDLLAAHGVPGIQGVDTRAITRRVREHGTLLCVFGPQSREGEMETILSKMKPPDLDDLVESVTLEKPVLINPGAQDGNGKNLPRLAVLDCGIKHNILRELSKRFEVIWCPASLSFDEIMSEWRPDAIFASNGPGDPAHPGSATAARNTLARAVREDMPVMGICLGHQLMGLAAGLRTYKLRYGHRGANQPVLDLVTGKVDITSQNHGFAVEDPERGMLAPHPSGACSESGENTLEADFEVRHVNANDRTVEGLDLVGKPAFTVQFHPEACPGPHDASPLFDRFADIVEDHLSGDPQAAIIGGGGS
ncbi:MAG: glutamine-hydrolyzing carbamoyl-phosphate synthase small subunit [Candidatus Thermoplasmatota archaeon]|nr:carbamoyl phosphate synthase small subunit [Euryarchaeota archaeon]MEC7743901.1 glutamine-hydrolyzing carbamoyl-phosphate synthase small subunit [Candidatus Thermoplasmatota archaeon]MED5273519.1 glutamine-hydrolyzing carbamoyl-phosphate synthase small subunit [Candidatus Thermoplasmatota archaeon]|tara:strand:- start:6070 stop:7404 length:1335 start_codon:yes stop_codon:yes gene_type:complete